MKKPRLFSMIHFRLFTAAVALVLVLACAAVGQAQQKLTVRLGDKTVLPCLGSVSGTWYFVDPESTDLVSGSGAPNERTCVLLLGHDNAGVSRTNDWRALVQVAPGQSASLRVPLQVAGELRCVISSDDAELSSFSAMTSGKRQLEVYAKDKPSDAAASALEETIASQQGMFSLTIHSRCSKSVMIRVENLTLTAEGQAPAALSLDPVRRPQPNRPAETIVGLDGITEQERAEINAQVQDHVACFPDLPRAMARELVVWDWKMQDGIGTVNEPRTYIDALEKRLPQVRAQLDDLAEAGEEPADEALVAAMNEKFATIEGAFAPVKESGDQKRAAELWMDLHNLRREAALANTLFPKSPLVFVKHVPSVMSHQLTQPYGYCARSGGGLYILDHPGLSAEARRVDTGLPPGNYMHPTLSYDGKTILFAYCPVESNPVKWGDEAALARHYQLYTIGCDGTGLKQLTDSPYDHFAPTYLPDGDIICSSTMRGGYHRCGRGPCFVYTIARMKPDGTDERPISYHETQEWNPTVTADGRVLYTRWDYVDRNAVFYQHLWTMRPDGTDVRIYYGNNTYSPCGYWETKQVPGSSKIMALGCPHHGMSAGSVVLLDNSLGVDGPEPVTRLTPEVLFPEAETPLPWVPEQPDAKDFDFVPQGCWNANSPEYPAERLSECEESKRWPVHCFKSPWPLSEKYFLASYSFDHLTGEAGPNLPNQFGLYWCDAFGTRELLYRDPNISSVWAMPLAAREAPPAYVSTLPEPTNEDGSLKPGRFFVQNVYESWPWSLPEGTKITSLRLVQVLPKTTPNANTPMVGAANASPGKQILGTVPVAEDGSAYFEVPAKIPFLMQLLDEKGRMVEGMRSLIYAQPGETQSCTGCHENRLEATTRQATIASRQEVPSPITPDPDGSKPLSYPILVQPVLDAKCVSCHNDEKAEGNINLTGAPDGTYTKSYNALIPFVSYSAWGLPDNNKEPMTEPKEFGVYASRLTEILDAGHYDCVLSDEEWQRLCSWIDGANALFYGTFNPEKQALQQAGERIDGPDLE